MIMYVLYSYSCDRGTIMNRELVNAATQVQEKAENLVYEIGQGLDNKALHSLALEVLFGVTELQKAMERNTTYEPSPSGTRYYVTDESVDYDEKAKVANEINKVTRRLKKWAKNTTQINSKILRLYLELQRACEKNITEDLLKSKYGNDTEFHKNFPQMKMISTRNHGKVFDEDNGIINIWEPVSAAVLEYERTVFKEDDI